MTRGPETTHEPEPMHDRGRVEVQAPAADAGARHLVIGATGVAGDGIVRHLLNTTDAPVFALSRAGRVPPEHVGRVEGIAADLFHRGSVLAALRACRPSHVYYAAHRHPIVGHVDGDGDVHPRAMQGLIRAIAPIAPLLDRLPLSSWWYYDAINRSAGLLDQGQSGAMLRSVVEALDLDEARGENGPRHLAVLTGGRAHGVHLGRALWPGFPEPQRADSPRHPGRSWYFDVEDQLLLRKPGQGRWTWSLHRPHFILGTATGVPYNIVNALGVWAVLLRDAGLPLIFPGGEAAFAARWDAVDAELIGAQMLWAARTPAAHDRAWMLTNGGALRWSVVWPAIASHFAMEWQVPPVACTLDDLLADPAARWDALRARQGLPPLPFAQVMPLPFLHQAMVVTWDVHYDDAPSRALGFDQVRDHVEVITRLLQRLERTGVLPGR